MLLPNGFKLEQGVPKVGGNGIVYTCVKENKRYALKLFTKNFEQYHHEVYICKTLKRHSNVIELIDHFELSEKKAIVLEYCSKDLKNHLQNQDLSLQEKLLLFGQVVSAFKSIQEDLNRIDFQFQHRDIKPENLMIGEGNKIKLIDFGESRIIAFNADIYEYIPSTQLCGTPGYMDPLMEYLNGGFSEKSDIWSLGATLYYILTNKQLVISKSIVNTVAKNASYGQKKNQKIIIIKELIQSQIKKYVENDDCKRLLLNLLNVDIKDRYDWCQLFSDSFMNQLMDKTSSIEQGPFIRKQIIRLKNDLHTKFVSPSLGRQAGPQLSQILKEMIKRGLSQFQTAQEMLVFFSEIKEKNNYFLMHWQIFEKCNYLLHLRSLITFYSYHQIFKELKCQHGKEFIENDLLIAFNDSQNSLLLERIQLQMYYLFDCVRKSMVGNGLEAKLIRLQKESDRDDYPGLLEITNEEKIYFSYKKYDQNNILNDLEYFENEEFYTLLKQYMIKCIKCCLQNYQVLKKDQVIFLKKLTLWYDYEKNNNIFQILENLNDQQSKMQILTSIIDNFNYLYEILEKQSILNTYFYFEILYSTQSNEEIEIIKKCLSRNYPGKLCFSVRKNDWIHENIVLNLKHHQTLSKIWCQADGIVNFKNMIRNQIHNAIQNS